MRYNEKVKAKDLSTCCLWRFQTNQAEQRLPPYNFQPLRRRKNPRELHDVDFIKGVRPAWLMSCTWGASVCEHPEACEWGEGLWANIGNKISISILTLGSCESLKIVLGSAFRWGGVSPWSNATQQQRKTPNKGTMGPFVFYSLGTFLPWSTSLVSHSPSAHMRTRRDSAVSLVLRLATRHLL